MKKKKFVNFGFKAKIFSLIICVAIFVFLYVYGFRITYNPKLETSWNAIGAIGQWASAVVGILIPIAVVYIQSILDQNKREIGKSNSELYSEFTKFKSEYLDKIKILSSLINEDEKPSIELGVLIDAAKYGYEYTLKERVIKFINISMAAHTKQIAKYINVTEAEAFDLLEEMVMKDESISCAGRHILVTGWHVKDNISEILKKDNISEIVWIGKKR